MSEYLSYSGTVTEISNFGAKTVSEYGCTQIISVSGSGGIVDFIITPDTYFVDHFMLRLGSRITAYYDASLPAPLIYPPQLRAAVVADYSPYRNVVVSYFDNQLLSSDKALQLLPGQNTLITLQNDQMFIGYPGGRNLAVVYTAATRSIPARTTPEQIVVLCSNRS